MRNVHRKKIKLAIASMLIWLSIGTVTAEADCNNIDCDNINRIETQQYCDILNKRYEGWWLDK